MRRRKKEILLIAALCLALLTGFGVKTVELLNDNPPLIDLEQAIQEAKFGQNGNEAHQIGDDPDKNSETTGTGKTIKVTVRGEGVWLEEHRFFSLDSLNTRLTGNYKSGDVILLVDDYAEAHFYREVLALIEKLNAEKGFAYSAD